MLNYSIPFSTPQLYMLKKCVGHGYILELSTSLEINGELLAMAMCNPRNEAPQLS
jgi:hypothetical protein